MSRRGWLIAGGLAVGAVIGLTPHKIIYDGTADFVVVVRPQPDLALRAVSVEAMNPAAAASAVAERTPSEFEADGKTGRTQRPFVNDPIRLRLWMTEIEWSALLWSSRPEYIQSRSLVVVWWPATGPRQAKAVSLPDLRTTRGMVVDLP